MENEIKRSIEGLLSQIKKDTNSGSAVSISIAVLNLANALNTIKNIPNQEQSPLEAIQNKPT